MLATPSASRVLVPRSSTAHSRATTDARSAPGGVSSVRLADGRPSSVSGASSASPSKHSERASSSRWSVGRSGVVPKVNHRPDAPPTPPPERTITATGLERGGSPSRLTASVRSACSDATSVGCDARIAFQSATACHAPRTCDGIGLGTPPSTCSTKTRASGSGCGGGGGGSDARRRATGGSIHAAASPMNPTEPSGEMCG